jgi:AraC-like DNA-binding protein
MSTQKFPDEPSSLSGWVVAVVRTISAAGVDPAPLLEAAAIDPMVLADPEARVPIRNMLILWRLAVEHTGDSAIGLRVPEHLSNASLYAINTLMEVAPTFIDGWKHLLKYSAVISTGIEINLHKIRDDEYDVRFDSLMPDAQAEPMPEAADAVLALFVSGMMLRMGGRMSVLEIYTPRREPENAAEYERLLGGPVRFGQNRLGFRLHCRGSETQSMPSANSNLESALQSVLADYLKRMEDNNLLSRVRSEIMALMTVEEPSLDRLAESFNMSGRSLQRKLVAKNSGYRQLVDEVRREMAEQLVQKSDLNFTDIAFRLGFRDASNFSRVFKRWVGMSPSEYRQRNL